MVIKKYAFLMGLLAWGVVFGGFAMNNQPFDEKYIQGMECFRKDLQILREKLVNGYKNNETLHVARELLAQFKIKHPDDSEFSDTTWMIRVLQDAIDCNRLDILKCFLEEVLQGKSLGSKQRMFEGFAQRAYKVGCAELFKYLMTELCKVEDSMDFRARYTVEEEDPYELCLYASWPLFMESSNRDLEDWVDVFGEYGDRAHFFSAQYVPDLKKELSDFWNFICDDLYSSKFGYTAKFEYLEKEAKSFFDGTYYQNALNNVCSWYKESAPKKREIIIECARIYGHHKIITALMVLGKNPMTYFRNRELGKK